MKKRNDFKELLKVNPDTELIFCDGKTVEEEPYIALEFFARQAKLNQLFLEFTAEEGVKWLFGYANYINQNYMGRHNIHSKHTFSVGTLVMVDFFGGYGNELTYDHPAIVLHDLRFGLIIAPLTSNPVTYRNAAKNALHIPLPKNVKSQGYLYKNSTIRLDQLRYISKTRVLKRMIRTDIRNKSQVNQRVSFISTLEQIELVLANFLSPHVFSNLKSEQKALEEGRISLEQEKLEYEQLKVQLEQDQLALEQEKIEFEQEKAVFFAKIGQNGSKTI